MNLELIPITIPTDAPEFLIWRHGDGSITMYNVFNHGEEVAWFWEADDGQWQYSRRKKSKRGRKYPTLDIAVRSVLLQERVFRAKYQYDKMLKSLEENPQSWQNSV